MLLLLVVLLLMQPYGALERIRDSKIKEKYRKGKGSPLLPHGIPIGQE